jgi:hypothetical protein
MSTDVFLESARNLLTRARAQAAEAEESLADSAVDDEQTVFVVAPDQVDLNQLTEDDLSHLTMRAVRAPRAPTGRGQKSAEEAVKKAKDSIKSTEEAAFQLQIHLELEAATSKFRPWQQIPAWVIAAFGIAIAFVLLFHDPKYSVAAWTFAALLEVLAVILMFRSKTKLDFGNADDSGNDQDDAGTTGGTAGNTTGGQTGG